MSQKLDGWIFNRFRQNLLGNRFLSESTVFNHHITVKEPSKDCSRVLCVSLMTLLNLTKINWNRYGHLIQSSVKHTKVYQVTNIWLSFFFAIFFKKIILIMKPSRAMSFTSLSKNYQMIPIQLMNLNCGSDKRLIMSLPMVTQRMRLKNFSRRILKN